MKDEDIKIYLNKYYIEQFVRFREDEILCAYKEFCRQFPNDEQIDQEWMNYSTWVNCRRNGEVFNEPDKD